MLTKEPVIIFICILIEVLQLVSMGAGSGLKCHPVTKKKWVSLNQTVAKKKKTNLKASLLPTEVGPIKAITSATLSR